MRLQLFGVVLALAAGSARSPAQAEVGGSMEVMRAGDGQMSCEALIGEYNQLSAGLQADQQAKVAAAQKLADDQRKKASAARVGRGLLGFAAGVAPFGLGSIGSYGGYIAANAAANGAAMAAAGAGDPAQIQAGYVQTGASAQQLRMDRLKDLINQKHC